jgi:hypothetical protein
MAAESAGGKNPCTPAARRFTPEKPCPGEWRALFLAELARFIPIVVVAVIVLPFRAAEPSRNVPPRRACCFFAFHLLLRKKSRRYDTPA